MSWTNEDVHDEIYEQDEEESPSWVDDKGKILEAAFCEYFLEKHPLMCLKQILFDLDGEVDEDKLIYEIHQEIRYHARNDVAKKVKRLVEVSKSRHTARSGNRSSTASTSKTAPTIWTSVASSQIENFV